MGYSAILYENQAAGETDYAIQFTGPEPGYLSSDHILLYRDGVKQESPRGFTFVDSKNVQLTTPTTAGENILFRRETPKDDQIVDFELDAVLTDTDLDTSALQSLYILHEVLDGFISLAALEGFDANNKKLFNVADGIADSDGVNLAQVISLINDKLVLEALEADEMLIRLKTVDGSGSGLDADLLDGHDTAYFGKASDVSAVTSKADKNEGDITNLGTAVGSLDSTLTDHKNEEGSDNPHNRIITSSVTYTVGSTGDYATLNSALEDLTYYEPVYKSSGVTVTLELQAGFVMAEQVLNYGLDLGWITITGVDAETEVTSAALTIDFTTDDYGFESYPIFGVSKGGTGPVIGQLFSFDVTGVDTDKHGIFTVGAGSSIEILSGAGCKGADGNNIYAFKSSTINADGAICSGAGTNGILANRSSFISVYDSDASGAGTFGIYAINSSIINAQNVIASNAGTHGVFAANGSTINAESADASGAGEYGIISTSASIIDANGADCSTAGIYGFYVSNSGIIDRTNGTGTTSQTLDTWTTSGYIS